MAVLCFVALQLQLGYGELKHTLSLLLHIKSVQHLTDPDNTMPLVYTSVTCSSNKSIARVCIVTSNVPDLVLYPDTCTEG